MSRNIQNQIKRLHKELATLTRQEHKVRERKASIIRDLGTLFDALKLLKIKGMISPLNADGGQGTMGFAISTATLTENTKLGDAISAILLEHGTLYQRNILEQLRKHGVPISPNNPYQVLGNTLKNDKRKRFVILGNRRIALRKDNG